MTPASTTADVGVELDIRCSDEDCRGRQKDIGDILIGGPNGFYCPYCRNFRFLLLRKKPIVQPPGKCFKCGGVTVSGNICDVCLRPALNELRKGDKSERQLEGNKGKD